MKTLILILVSFAAYGQMNEVEIKPEFKMTSVKPKGDNYIVTALYITSGNSKSSIRSLYFEMASDTSKLAYDNFVKNNKRYYNAKNRRKEVAVYIGSFYKEYTFEEFRKILWP